MVFGQGAAPIRFDQVLRRSLCRRRVARSVAFSVALDRLSARWGRPKVYYDYAPDKYCCVMADVPLLAPDWPTASNATYMGTSVFDGQSVNGWGPYPTNLYYFESLGENLAAGWTSDQTVTQMKWYEDLTNLSRSDADWWGAFMAVPGYCRTAEQCANSMRMQHRVQKLAPI